MPQKTKPNVNREEPERPFADPAQDPSTVPEVNTFSEHFFSTEHLKANLRQRTARGIVTSLSSNALTFAMQIASTMILARLLVPADFGLVAMASVFIGFIHLFQDMGLSSATVQRAKITQAEVSNLFWINLGASAVLALIAAAAGPLVSWFYREPRIAPIMLVGGASFLVAGASAQHGALLRRQMRLTTLAVRDVASSACGVGAGVLLALNGAGYWALVAMTLVQAAAKSIFLCFRSGWWPSRPTRSADVRDLCRYGAHRTLFDAVHYFGRKGDDILIGWMLGAGPLGLYTKAYSLLLLPITQVTAPLTSTVIPALSALRSDPERYRRFYRKALEGIAIVNTPLVFASFVLADPLVLLLLGPGWSETATLYRLLSPAALMAVTNVATGWVYNSWGHVHRQSRMGILTSFIHVTAIVCGSIWGLTGIALAVSASRMSLKVPTAMYCYRGTPVRLSDFFMATWRSIAASTAAAIATFIFIWFWPGLKAFPMVACGFIVFGFAYCIGLLLLPGFRDTPAAIFKALLKDDSRRTRSRINKVSSERLP